MSGATKPRVRKAVPWRGRPRVEDPKTSFISVRCTGSERETIDESASIAGLSVGAYLRTLALGKAGPRARRRPPPSRRPSLPACSVILESLAPMLTNLPTPITVRVGYPPWPSWLP